jgi:hypothetical protein
MSIRRRVNIVFTLLHISHFSSLTSHLSNALFVWLISHQPAVLFSQNKPTTSNQPAVLFSQSKSAPAIRHQPNEQAVTLHYLTTLIMIHNNEQTRGSTSKVQTSD